MAVKGEPHAPALPRGSNPPENPLRRQGGGGWGVVPPPAQSFLMISFSFTRRHFLRGAGACVALPFLETFARGAEKRAPIQRLVCVANPFGMINGAFFPEQAGRAAALPETLKPLEDWRGQFTVF